MAKHRTHSLSSSGRSRRSSLEGSRSTRSPTHGMSRNLIRVWVQKYEAGGLDGDAAAADLRPTPGANRPTLERLVGRWPWNRVSKGGTEARTAAAKRDHVRYCRPAGLSSQKDVSNGISRSTYYDEPDPALGEAACRRDEGDLRRVRPMAIGVWRRAPC